MHTSDSNFAPLSSFDDVISGLSIAFRTSRTLILLPLLAVGCATPASIESDTASQPAPTVTPTVQTEAEPKTVDTMEISSAPVQSTPIELEGWPTETFALPPDFAPELPKGSESLLFAPGWRDPSTEEFWSYAFVMSIDEAAADETRVREILNQYYDGLMRVFAHGKDIGSDPAQFDIELVAPNRYEVDMYVVDAFATFNAMLVHVLVDVIPESDAQSKLTVRLSPQPKEHAIWRSLEAAIAKIESTEPTTE